MSIRILDGRNDGESYYFGPYLVHNAFNTSACGWSDRVCAGPGEVAAISDPGGPRQFCRYVVGPVAEVIAFLRQQEGERGVELAEAISADLRAMGSMPATPAELLAQAIGCTYVDAAQIARAAKVAGVVLTTLAKPQKERDMAHYTFGYYIPGTRIIAAAVHCAEDQDPSAVAANLGVPLDGYERREGCVQFWPSSGVPFSPEQDYRDRLRTTASAILAETDHLPTEREMYRRGGFRACDYRWVAKEHCRLSDEADAAAAAVTAPPTQAEPTWVWTEKGGVQIA